MHSRKPPLRHRLVGTAVGSVALCAVFAASAPAASAPGEGSLSSRLATLAAPQLRSAPPAEQAEALSLPASGPGGLVRKGNRVLAEARFESGAAVAVEPLREAGAEVLHVSPRHQTVTVAVRPADLRGLASLPRLASVSEVLAPIVRGPDCGGAVRSEGDVQLNSGNARRAFVVDGSGVTVGILSDTFDRDAEAVTHAAQDVASGDLPGPGSPCGTTAPVRILDGDPEPEGSDEGRAMAQIVRDVAPGAAIAFASAFQGETAFADKIRALWRSGARVIVDDVGYVTEPFFQDGPVAVAVNQVAAAGATYFSAAGNDNLIDAQGRDIASWEAPSYRDAAVCPPALVLAAEAEHCMDFDPAPGPVAVDSTFGLTVAKGATLRVDLQWAEPWNGIQTDLDVFLLDAAGDPISVEEESETFLVGSANDNITAQRPVEFFTWENDSGATANVQIAVVRCFAVCNPAANPATMPRLKLALAQNGSGVSAVERPESSGGDLVGPSIYGHAAASGAIAVGAVRYDDGSKPERYSSRGPVRHFFGPVAGAAPAAPLETTISKPDIAASDCGVTTFFFRSNPSVQPPFRFCGTSAAAPHAAAVAALMHQAGPALSAGQVRATLTATAQPVGAFGPTAVGAGLLDAFAAVASVSPPPRLTVTQRPEPLSRNRRPSVSFVADRPVAFTCEVDGVAQPCASPFTAPLALADGTHGIAVRATDLGGHGVSSGNIAFSIDTKAPRTFIARHPRKVVRTKKKRVRRVIRFRASEPGTTFVCKIDRDLWRFCPRRIVKRFKVGRHAIRVRARDAAGNVDRTAAVFRFRVKRVGRGR